MESKNTIFLGRRERVISIGNSHHKYLFSIIVVPSTTVSYKELIKTNEKTWMGCLNQFLYLNDCFLADYIIESLYETEVTIETHDYREILVVERAGPHEDLLKQINKDLPIDVAEIKKRAIIKK